MPRGGCLQSATAVCSGGSGDFQRWAECRRSVTSRCCYRVAGLCRTLLPLLTSMINNSQTVRVPPVVYASLSQATQCPVSFCAGRVGPMLCSLPCWSPSDCLVECLVGEFLLLAVLCRAAYTTLHMHQQQRKRTVAAECACGVLHYMRLLSGPHPRTGTGTTGAQTWTLGCFGAGIASDDSSSHPWPRGGVPLNSP